MESNAPAAADAGAPEPNTGAAEQTPAPGVFNATTWYVAERVGVGTDAPVHRLSVLGGPHWTTAHWFGALELSNGAAIAWQSNTAENRFGMGHTDGGFYVFRTRSDPGTTDARDQYDLVIDDEGKVGIGNRKPLSKLHVQGGDILVTGGGFIDDGTTLTVPDHVFAVDYPLRSLAELRAYVAQEKHLPDVPDAEQIKAGGLNLSEFQMKLLEKIEELTLYTLRQDEQLAQQAEQLASQQQQLARLTQQHAELAARLAALEAQQ
jgi:hypothetical protein